MRWRKGLNFITNTFQLGAVMIGLSFAIHWATLATWRFVGVFGMIPLAVIVGVILEARRN